MAQPAILTPERLERALAQVYARPEFAPVAPSAWSTWVSHAWSAVKRFLADLFPAGTVSEGGGRVLAWAVIGVLVISALLMAAHLVLSATGLWRARDPSGRERPDGSAAPGVAEAAYWEDAARRAAGAGHWREAALALYPALLLRLAERGAVRYDAAKTPGDYRRETRAEPDTYRTLNEFLRIFEPVAFGGRAVDAPRYERLRAAATAGGARA